MSARSKVLDRHWREDWHRRHFGAFKTSLTANSIYPKHPPFRVDSNLGNNTGHGNRATAQWTCVQGTATDCVEHFLATGRPVFMDSTRHSLLYSPNCRNLGSYDATVMPAPVDELDSASRVVDLSFHFECCPNDSDIEFERVVEAATSIPNPSEQDGQDRHALATVSEDAVSCSVSPAEFPSWADSAFACSNWDNIAHGSGLCRNPATTCSSSPKGESAKARERPFSPQGALVAAHCSASENLEPPRPAASALPRPASPPAAIPAAGPAEPGPGGLQPECDSEDDTEACVAIYAHAAAW